MTISITRVYTRTGDKGETALVGTSPVMSEGLAGVLHPDRKCWRIAAQQGLFFAVGVAPVLHRGAPTSAVSCISSSPFARERYARVRS